MCSCFLVKQSLISYSVHLLSDHYGNIDLRVSFPSTWSSCLNKFIANLYCFADTRELKEHQQAVQSVRLYQYASQCIKSMWTEVCVSSQCGQKSVYQVSMVRSLCIKSIWSEVCVSSQYGQKSVYQVSMVRSLCIKSIWSEVCVSSQCGQKSVYQVNMVRSLCIKSVWSEVCVSSQYGQKSVYHW